MNKYYPFKDKQEVLDAIERHKKKLETATTEFDVFYLNMMIIELEKMAKE